MRQNSHLPSADGVFDLDAMLPIPLTGNEGSTSRPCSVI